MRQHLLLEIDYLFLLSSLPDTLLEGNNTLTRHQMILVKMAGLKNNSEILDYFSCNV